ncbi:MAG: hypothetical protein ACKO2V_27295 [Snowella sp.]
MSIKSAQTKSSKKEDSHTPPVHDGTELYDSQTPDSYDPHIIPAEIAARKEHEGEHFKHLTEHPPGSESMDTTSGYRVDKEGLVDNFGIEPEMYYEEPGDLSSKKQNKPKAE